MASSNTAFVCEICNGEYDSDLRKPLVLSCGHTFCYACHVKIASTEDRKCPNCRILITQTIDQLAINFALMTCKEKVSSLSLSSKFADLCWNHECPLDYFCVDCRDFGCWKCSRDFHLTHRVESFDGIMSDVSVAYAKTELRQELQRKVDEIKRISLIRTKMQSHENPNKYEKESKFWDGFEQVSESSVANDLETWDALISNPAEKDKKTLKEILRRLSYWKSPRIQNLLGIEEQKTESTDLRKLAQEYIRDLNSEAALETVDTSELLTNNEHWTVSSEASITRALASISAGHRPTKVSVFSVPGEPIRQFSARLNALGNACFGAVEVVPLDFFWRASTGSDERIQSFIRKHGHKVSKFYCSPEDALLVCRASRQSPLLLGVRLCNMIDLDRCSALTVKPTRVCCIRGLPETAGSRMLELGWRPGSWYFPDIHDMDLDWMLAILKKFEPSTFSLASSSGSCVLKQQNRCWLPRCRLSEKGFRILLDKCHYLTAILCAPGLFSAQGRKRLADLAEISKVQLQWTMAP